MYKETNTVRSITKTFTKYSIPNNIFIKNKKSLSDKIDNI